MIPRSLWHLARRGWHHLEDWRWPPCSPRSELLATPQGLLADQPLQAGERTAVMVCLAPGGTPGPHVAIALAALRQAGFLPRVVAVVDAAVDAAMARRLGQALPGPLLWRCNGGWDFAAWATALYRWPQIWSHSQDCLFLNDSTLFPLRGWEVCRSRLQSAGPARVTCLTDSHVPVRHGQSYFLHFNRAALAHPASRRFWEQVRQKSDRDAVIRGYELRLWAWLRRRGLQVETLFPSAPGRGNPCLTDWPYLQRRGCPMVKLSLLRDNPEGCDLGDWETELEQLGYPVPVARAAIAHSLRARAVPTPRPDRGQAAPG